MPSRVDRDRHDLEARLLDDQPMLVPAGILERDPLDPASRQPAAEQREGLAEAGADQHLLRLGGGAAHAPEVVGECLPQSRHAARIGIADGIDRRLSPSCPQRAQPAIARKAGEVGQAGVEVVGEAGQHRARRRPRARGAHRPRHPHRRTLPRQQVALGRELAVGLGDDAAGDAQLPRQRPARGQPRPRGKAAGLDRALASRASALGDPSTSMPGPPTGPSDRCHYWHCISGQCIPRRELPPAEEDVMVRQNGNRTTITVVGGGLAGLTAAIACAEGGARGAAAGGARGARRPRAQHRRPLQGQPRPPRHLQGRPFLGLARRARPAAALRGAAAPGIRFRWQGATRRTPPLATVPSGPAAARARSPGRHRFPQLGRRPQRRAHRRDALRRRRRLHLPPRPGGAFRGLRLEALGPGSAQPTAHRALPDRRLERAGRLARRTGAPARRRDRDRATRRRAAGRADDRRDRARRRQASCSATTRSSGPAATRSASTSGFDPAPRRSIRRLRSRRGRLGRALQRPRPVAGPGRRGARPGADAGAAGESTEQAALRLDRLLDVSLPGLARARDLAPAAGDGRPHRAARPPRQELARPAGSRPRRRRLPRRRHGRRARPSLRGLLGERGGAPAEATAVAAAGRGFSAPLRSPVRPA